MYKAAKVGSLMMFPMGQTLDDVQDEGGTDLSIQSIASSRLLIRCMLRMVPLIFWRKMGDELHDYKRRQSQVLLSSRRVGFDLTGLPPLEPYHGFLSTPE